MLSNMSIIIKEELDDAIKQEDRFLNIALSERLTGQDIDTGYKESSPPFKQEKLPCKYEDIPGAVIKCEQEDEGAITKFIMQGGNEASPTLAEQHNEAELGPVKQETLPCIYEDIPGAVIKREQEDEGAITKFIMPGGNEVSPALAEQYIEAEYEPVKQELLSYKYEDLEGKSFEGSLHDSSWNDQILVIDAKQDVASDPPGASSTGSNYAMEYTSHLSEHTENASLRTLLGDEPNDCSPKQRGETLLNKLQSSAHAESNLTSNARIHTREKPHACLICDKRFAFRSGVTKHTRIHTRRYPYTCEECGKSFSHKSSLINHIRIHTREKPFTCKECGKSFSHKGNLMIHTRTHTGEKPFACKECGKSFSHKSSLISHSRTHTGEKPFACKECGTTFSHKCSLINHIRNHTGENPFTCKECGKSFSHKSSLISHSRVHTSEKPFACKECDQSFSQKCDLVSHARTHTREKRFACEECGKSFSRKTCLIIHIRIHTGEKPFTCKECGKSFSRKCNLISHTRTHTGEKPFACKECGTSFSHKGTLINHIRIHTGEKPYTCKECGKSFSQNSVLTMHTVTHKRERPFESTRPNSHLRKTFSVVRVFSTTSGLQIASDENKQ